MKKILVIIFLIIACLIVVFNINKVEKEPAIKFASWGSQSEVKILKELLSDFEKETQIKVDFMHIPQNYFQKLHLLFASNLAPDVIFINNHYLKMYTDANLLEDLTPYIKDKNEFYNTAIDCLSDKGKIYAIPRDISNLVIYVNKDLFKKSGIKYKKQFNSLNELKETAQELTNKEHFGINYEEDSLYWIYYLGANGGGILSDDLKHLKIKDKESIEALNFYSDLANKYNIAPKKAQIGSMTTAQMFINGQIAMYLGGRWMIPKFRETINFDWDIMQFPSSQENKIFVDASGWAISKQSKNKDNVLKLVLYLSCEKAINKLSQSGLIIPARKKSAEYYIISDKENKPNHAEIFIKTLENAKPTPINKHYGRINDILKDKLQSVLFGERSTEDALDEKTIKKLEGLL